MKLIAPIVFLLTLLVAGLLGFLWWNSATAAPGTSSEEVRFTITRGSSAETIGKNLKEAGLIRDTFALKIYLQSKGLVAKLPPGQFKIAKNLKLPELVSVLLKGPVELWVTIPEGLRREQYPEIFAAGLELSPADATSFEEEFLLATENLEGFLYPDTYLFPPNVTAEQVISVLRNTFDKKFTPTQEELDAVGLTLDEAVTLASIIERETRNASERPTVVGVYLNRLGADWPLQADATIQYVTGDSEDWWKTPTTAQKEVNSFYNTYKYPGLPPAPIANPSLTSLEAVINPEDTDFWFYLHDPDGVIHFAQTLEEHNLNVQRYLR
ncbi:hypothetical protein A2803_04365 [Candidatus Woesebacteria bacterium RIFCSPHIGHO2_01_FULL_44_21]|uniref:Endolytic murein transglycosylase n=1 Tax=Candidatus Woesebacteria bacterium RIFCSPHIGHO2_01_FULL_44_21 TaxID=1802503 RepID=A0A1F7Z1S4_9BACT|nr:MAG: hypothetical protein A2803_04365 [Candidatus Woesebacteria bacterium RIFCSPHIGHO2_01_FULL_44_21]OGM71501.1 MAG: hypothetical protein A2897_04250 [Candidatus Woesebacteria bacterium RIFCSPLOWO2_01_FULL_44_24b]